MGKFVNPFTDVGFKVIFGSELSKDLLIAFLNELLLGEHKIEDLFFLDKEDWADNIHNRGIVYDIFCRTTDGKNIIVEMQNRWHSHFLDRTLYYVCRGISRQGKLAPEREERKKASYGERYKLSDVYGVFLMNFKEEGLAAKFRTDTYIIDRETGKVINPHFRQIYLQFPYFIKELKECETLFDKWIYTLKHMDSWDRMPEGLKGQVFERLAHLAAIANLSEADEIAYQKALDQYYIEQTVRHDQYVKGREEGREAGLIEGREAGKAEGKIEGKIEGERRGIEKVALQMKEKGLPIEMIAECTGLSATEIQALS